MQEIFLMDSMRILSSHLNHELTTNLRRRFGAPCVIVATASPDVIQPHSGLTVFESAWRIDTLVQFPITDSPPSPGTFKSTSISFIYNCI